MKKNLWSLVWICNLFFKTFGTTAEHYQLFLWGYYNQLQNKYSIAEQCYEKILGENAPAEAYLGYIELLYRQNNYQKIYHLIPKLEVALKHSLPIQIIFVKCLEKVGRQKEADEKIIILAKQYEENAEIVYTACLAYFRLQKLNESLALIDNYIKKNENEARASIFYFLKAQIFMKLDQKQKALEAIQKTLVLNPGLKEGWLLSGAINEMEGNLKEAQKNYQNFLSISLQEQSTEARFLQMILKQQYPSGLDQREELLQKALALYAKKDFESALDMIEPYIMHYTQDEDAQILFVELLCACGKSAKALQHLMLLIEHDYKPLWLRALHLLYLAGIQQSEIKKIFKTISNQMPQNALAKLYVADINLKEKMYSQALQDLNNALLLTENVAQKSKIFYQIALIHYEKKEYNLLSKLFDKYAHLAQHFDPLANVMAYYYASKKNEPTKAKKILATFINKTNNPHFLETKAFILYKEKKYKEAQKIFNVLFQIIPDDFFALKHASKLYREIGDIKKAISLLEKSLDHAPMSKKGKYTILLNNWKKELIHEKN